MEKQGAVTAHERNCVILLALTCAIQSGHMVEHIAQFIQWMVRMRIEQGLIGEFDLEPIHFAFNGLLLVGLSALAAFYGDVLRARGNRPYAVFLFAWGVQTYHMVEHVVKYAQYVETGLQGTPGILGRYLPSIPYHFALNLAVTVPIIMAFFMLGMHRTLLRIAAPARFRGK